MTTERKGEARAMRHEAAARPSPTSYERRLGSRARVSGAALSWLPVLPPKRFRHPRAPQQATLVDLSITGARIKASVDNAIARGTHVEIQVKDAWGVVKVRRIDAASEPEMALYGVEFLQLNAPLSDLIDRTLAVRKPNERYWRWNYKQ